MAEELRSRDEVCQRLRISTRSFSRYKTRFYALGLQPVQVGLSTKYLESSVDRLIKNLIERGQYA